MTALILAAAIAGHPDRGAVLIDPVFLDTLSVREARKLDGAKVFVEFTVDVPTFTLNGVTMTGPAPREEGIERTVFFRGKATAVYVERMEGKSLRVSGVLQVIEHKARSIGATTFPAFVELRIEHTVLAP